ncbi:hypothetical protein Dsin_009424 [Dipteronia sinensis]|uniref:Pentatricopeptide repeat-containing protein n=1 Tax=Dipteronia sinensis TaxID=43782 RepID=A0AAE0EBW9_9ROSI|nr:hypothetical protein Dsin_009424 [Dipteronia sinensis]
MIRRLFLQFRSISAHIFPTPPQTRLLQCNKRIQRLAKLGRVKEARHLFDSMPLRDTVSYNSMISCYTHNKYLLEARSLFDSFQDKNIVTWTILISGYAKYRLMNEARMVFDSMPERNVVSWNALLTGYVQNGQVRIAREVFDKMPERNVPSWNSMITGYCQYRMVREAREMFDRMEERNSVSWLIMISGYVEVSEYRKSWVVFLMMLRTGLMPDQALFVVGLSAIVGLNNLDLVGSIRTMAIKLGYEEDVVVGTSILNAYSRNGSLDDAYKFFERMPKRNEYSCTSMLAAFARCGRLDDAVALYESGSCDKGVEIKTTMLAAYAQKGNISKARRIFDEIKYPNVVTWNAMVSGYAQNGMLEEANLMFVRMPVRNAATWSTMISGFVQNGKCKEALELFVELHRTGNIPSHSGFTTALSACANIGDEELGKQIHLLTIKTRCQYNLHIGNGLISMYAKCKNMEYVSQAFRTMQVRDTVSWNSLIAGVLENHTLDDALNTFQKMPKRDEVSWTAIISAFLQAGEVENALKFFLDMLATGTKPTELIITRFLSACGPFDATKLGEQFHAFIYKHGYNSWLCVSNALITMYFKSETVDGLCVFEDMPIRDIVSWNTVLTGCAHLGLGKEAIYLFEQMEAAGVLPDEISFLGVISACSNAGLVEKGWTYFNSMSQNYGITPSDSHYTCMVDLLARAGQLIDDQALIKNMPVKPGCVA